MPEWSPQTSGDILMGTVVYLSYEQTEEKGVQIFIDDGDDVYWIYKPLLKGPFPDIGEVVLIQYMAGIGNGQQQLPIYTSYTWKPEDKRWVVTGKQSPTYTPAELAQEIGRPVEELRAASE